MRRLRWIWGPAQPPFYEGASLAEDCNREGKPIDRKLKESRHLSRGPASESPKLAMSISLLELSARQLEEENRRLKAIVADQALDIRALKDCWQKTVTARGEPSDGGGSNDYASSVAASRLWADRDHAASGRRSTRTKNRQALTYDRDTGRGKTTSTGWSYPVRRSLSSWLVRGVLE